MIDTIKVKIKGKKYNLKNHAFRAMFLFEEMTGKSIVDVELLKDQVAYLYCLFKASNDSFEFTLDEFIDILEDDTKIFTDFLQHISKKKVLT